MHINRQLSEIIEKSKKSVLLLGPRQTGKSTLINSLKPNLMINLADQQEFLDHLKDPQLIKALSQNKQSVFIDEVQRIPSLLNTIQSILDSKGKTKFYLSGSSARKLKKGEANLLPGRIHTFNLGGLTSLEIGENFNLTQALQRGTLPGVYLESEQWQKTLRSYFSTYIKEEIQAEALTRNIEGFSRYLDVLCGLSGSIMDFTKFSRLASVERMTAVRYFEVLCDTLIMNKIESFAKSNYRRLTQHPKFYLFDVGVYNAAQNNFNLSLDRIGIILEHHVQNQIRSFAYSKDLPFRISYYQTENEAEVDFILEIQNQIVAIEVKATKTIGGHDFKGIKSLETFLGKKKFKKIIVYTGSRKYTDDDVLLCPTEQLLEELVQSF